MASFFEEDSNQTILYFGSTITNLKDYNQIYSIIKMKSSSSIQMIYFSFLTRDIQVTISLKIESDGPNRFIFKY